MSGVSDPYGRRRSMVSGSALIDCWFGGFRPSVICAPRLASSLPRSDRSLSIRRCSPSERRSPYSALVRGSGNVCSASGTPRFFASSCSSFSRWYSSSTRKRDAQKLPSVRARSVAPSLKNLLIHPHETCTCCT